VTIVVDASAAYVALSGSGADAALREADELIAPDLLVAELLDARWKMMRARYAAPALELTLAFVSRVRLVSSFDYANDADTLARSIDHPVYDCLYAAVAARANATLVTADARFAKKLPNVRSAVVSAT